MSERVPGALPEPGTLIGRKDSVARVLELLDASPLVTLTGAAGVGKTQLAVVAGHASASRFRDGVVWVDLVPVNDPRDLVAVLMAAFGVRDTGEGPPLEGLARVIADRHALLVLDNAEHVVAAARDAVRALLNGCPGLAVLVTSREPLDVEGETHWVVPSLEVPDPDSTPALEELLEVPAVALFVARARDAVPGYVLTADEMDAVAEICRGLDGIPLAIEFAAARVRALPVTAIAERLEHALSLLGESPTARPRHMTLRAALDWSHALLDARERTLLRRLAVFSGSFSLESAEAICSGEGLEEHEIAGLLADLVERSLVVPLREGALQARYRLLETVRQYGRERLQEAGEVAEYEQRHAEHFLSIAETAEPLVRASKDQLEWHRRLIAEYDNLRAVLQRSIIDDGLSPTGVRMAAALGWWWYIFGARLSEAREWLELAATTPRPTDRTDAAPFGRALLWAGFFAWDRGDLPLSRQRAETALALLDDVEPWFAAVTVMLQAFIAAIEGDFERMSERFAEARRRFDETGDRWGPAGITSTEATGARLFGDLPGAQRAFESAAATLREVGDENGRWAPLHNLYQLALEDGDLPQAAAVLGEGLAGTLRFDNRWAACFFIAGVGHAAAVKGQSLRAAELLGASFALIERMGSQFQPQDRLLYEAVTDEVRAATEQHRFSEAWERGRALTFEAAVALAEEVIDDLAVNRADAEMLTPRQQQVAALIGKGLTNREIAAALTISEHTAERHVENILAKLQLSSRVQIATWVKGRRERDHAT
ncbi:MAG TPA: LuxR C-terminal-related transcriptional regulator [Actinomycetota bacterium]|nr:LuxR C-terminal-related transcriptional regulator [Actinomycetota bacterium]